MLDKLFSIDNVLRLHQYVDGFVLIAVDAGILTSRRHKRSEPCLVAIIATVASITVLSSTPSSSFCATSSIGKKHLKIPLSVCDLETGCPLASR